MVKITNNYGYRLKTRLPGDPKKNYLYRIQVATPLMRRWPPDMPWLNGLGTFKHTSRDGSQPMDYHLW